MRRGLPPIVIAILMIAGCRPEVLAQLSDEAWPGREPSALEWRHSGLIVDATLERIDVLRYEEQTPCCVPGPRKLWELALTFRVDEIRKGVCPASPITLRDRECHSWNWTGRIERGHFYFCEPARSDRCRIFFSGASPERSRRAYVIFFADHAWPDTAPEGRSRKPVPPSIPSRPPSGLFDRYWENDPEPAAQTEEEQP